MKGSYLYTLVFTFVVSALFAALLASVYRVYLPVITENEENVHRSAILKVLGAEADPALFAEQVQSVTVGGSTSFLLADAEGNALAYAFPLEGQGLWGTIRGYIGLSPEFDRLLGLEFVEQNETPGLGGRIEEEWFKEQFRGLSLSPGSELVYGEEIVAVTGATSSSQAVLRLLNQTLAELLPLREVLAR